MCTSSSRDSHASPSHAPVRVKAWKTSAGSGPQPPQLFAHYVRRGRYWRTCRDYFSGSSERLSGPWPPSGMTRNGTAYRLPRSVPLTGVIAFSSLPTPTANIAIGKGDLDAVVRYGRTYHGGGMRAVAVSGGGRRDPRAGGLASQARWFEPPHRGGADQHWAVEPDVGRVADGVPSRMDRLRGLGNAVVPQVAEHLGRCIIAADKREGGSR